MPDPTSIRDGPGLDIDIRWPDVGAMSKGPGRGPYQDTLSFCFYIAFYSLLAAATATARGRLTWHTDLHSIIRLLTTYYFSF